MAGDGADVRAVRRRAFRSRSAGPVTSPAVSFRAPAPPHRATPHGPPSRLTDPTTSRGEREVAGPAGAATEPSAAWSDELPNTRIELILELDGGWELELGGRPRAVTSFAAGLIAGRVRTRPTGGTRLVQLGIDPLAAPALLGVPASELAATAIDLGALLGPDLDRLLDRIHDAPDGGTHLVETWARDRVRRSEADRGPSVPADLIRACRLMRAGGGALRVEAVADELGCSRRHLARRFRQHLGCSARTYTRLLRFERAVAGLRADPTRPIGALAIDCDFADHAHLDREFRALAGATPSMVASRFAL